MRSPQDVSTSTWSLRCLQWGTQHQLQGSEDWGVFLRHCLSHQHTELPETTLRCQHQLHPATEKISVQRKNSGAFLLFLLSPVTSYIYKYKGSSQSLCSNHSTWGIICKISLLRLVSSGESYEATTLFYVPFIIHPLKRWLLHCFPCSSLMFYCLDYTERHRPGWALAELVPVAAWGGSKNLKSRTSTRWWRTDSL